MRRTTAKRNRENIELKILLIEEFRAKQLHLKFSFIVGQHEQLPDTFSPVFRGKLAYNSMKSLPLYRLPGARKRLPAYGNQIIKGL